MVAGNHRLMADEGTVYLLHFERPCSGRVRHYIGFTRDDLDQRLESHRQGGASWSMTGEHSFTLTPVEGGTRLVQTEIYSGLLAHFSNKTTSSFQTSFQTLNDAIKDRAENGTAEPGPTI